MSSAPAAAAAAAAAAGGAGHPPADEEEDVIDGVIRKSGCEVAFRKFEDCMVETNRDFRQCAPHALSLQKCMAAAKKVQESDSGKG